MSDINVTDLSLRVPFPKVLDNTMVSAYRLCPRKWWWRHQQMLQKTETSIHLVSGGAFARGLEIVRKSYFDLEMPFEDALCHGAAALYAAYGFVEPHPKYAAKNANNMVGALAYYFDQWPINRTIRPYRPAPSARHTIEWNFSIPIPDIKHPETGEAILYCGRFDMIGEHEAYPCLMGEDDKTTSQLGQSWFDRWRLANQILGYCYGAREHGIKLGGFNIRGISLLKNNYGHAETLQLINNWQIDRFLTNLQMTLRRMIAEWERGHFEYDMGSACTQFGGCDYLPLCESPIPEAWIELNYVKSEWNPLASRD